MRCPFSCIVLLMLPVGPGWGFDPSSYRLIDLSHAYDERTIYWPTETARFQHRELSFGETANGFFYSAYSFCTPEHGGTHLDAPIHFSAGGKTADAIPLENLVAPGVLIDVTVQTRADRNYRLTVEEVREFETRHGAIPRGSIVLLRTGWSRHWPDVRAYLGDDTPGDASGLAFPSYGVDAARLLVEERRVAMLGVDTASIDYGPSKDFPVHRLAASRNVAGLENLTRLDTLPATGFIVLALPMKIAGGSGGPVRVLAMLPR